MGPDNGTGDVVDFTLTPDVRFRTYYVIFRQGRIFGWWFRYFTIPGFEHCSVLENVGCPGEGLAHIDYCLHTETCFGLTIQQIYWENAVKMVAEKLAAGRITAVAVVEVDKRFSKRYIPFGLFTCVTIVKSLLGVHNWKVQTPHGLLRYLERQGALVVRSV